LRISDSDAVGG